jgi:hypothetical protein
MGHAHVLGMSAGITPEGVSVTVYTAGGVTQQRFLQFRVRVGVVAERPQVVLAEPTFATADERGHDDAIAPFHFPDLATDVNYFTHEFVPDHVSGTHGWDVPTYKVQV